MAKKNPKRELANFTGVLQAVDIDPRCVQQAVGNVPKLVTAYETQLENRAGRRVRKPVRRAVLRTLAHLTSAARHVGDGSPSRADARKLIRFAACCDDFAELERRASQYRGRHNKIVRGINDRKAQEAAREIWLDGDHSLLELKTISQLRSVGKRLRNCIGGDLGSHYRDALMRRESEFWALRHKGKDMGLLSIDVNRRTIEDFEGAGNEPVGWERHLLLELQRVLSAAGDEIEEFVELGAFALFFQQPSLRPVPVQIGKRTYQTWSSGSELILRDDRNRWSRFSLAFGRQHEFPSCEATYYSALDVQELVCLVAVSPELAKVVAQCLPESNAGDVGYAAREPRRTRRRRTRRGL